MDWGHHDASTGKGGLEVSVDVERPAGQGATQESWCHCDGAGLKHIQVA